jgi:alcohol dehydrogenase YqhD (iron-dependent ADH family)
LSGAGLHKNAFSYAPESFIRVVVCDRFYSGTLSDSLDSEYLIVVSEEPRVEQVRKAVDEMTDRPLNIVSIGGGSTIDFAKAIIGFRTFPEATRIGYDLPREKFESNYFSKDFHVAIPTTISSGSESSRYMLLFDEHAKVAHRHWILTPNLSILDPTLLKSNTNISLGRQLLDSWVHAFETYISTHESSWLNSMSFNWVNIKIESVLHKLLMDVSPTLDELNELQFISYLNGILISHTRTGALHTVGESIASLGSKVSHPLSLFIASKNYDHLTPLNDSNFSRRPDLGNVFWKDTINNFSAFGDFFTDKVEYLSDSSVQEFEVFCDRVLSDKVLWEKEHPVQVDAQVLQEYLELTYHDFLKLSRH